MAAAIDDDALVSDVMFARKLDDLLASITSIRIVGDVEVSREGEQNDSETTGASVSLGFGPKPSAEVRLSTQGAGDRRELRRVFQRLAGRLNELDVDPDDTTRRLFEELTGPARRRRR